MDAGGSEEAAEAHSLELAEGTATTQKDDSAGSSSSTVLIAGAVGGAAVLVAAVALALFLKTRLANANSKSRVSPAGSRTSIEL